MVMSVSLIEKLEALDTYSHHDKFNDYHVECLSKKRVLDIIRQHTATQSVTDCNQLVSSEIRLLSECCEKDVTSRRFCPACGQECRVKEATREPVSSHTLPTNRHPMDHLPHIQHAIDTWDCRGKSEQEEIAYLVGFREGEDEARMMQQSSPPKPVSVSLSKCANELYAMRRNLEIRTCRAFAKAVLDAAGVKYVD